MTRLTQVLAGAALDDPVTDLALQLRALLPPGSDGGIVAHDVEPAVAGVVRRLGSLAARAGAADDVLLVHVSSGEPALRSWLAGRPERLAVLHHGTRPPASMGLPALVARAEVLLAVSERAAAELVAAGGREVAVCPAVVEPDRLGTVAPDAPTAAHLARLDGPVVLHVGQLLPGDRIDHLLQAYHLLVTRHLPDAHLVVVGAKRLPGWAACLQRYVEELNLPRAWLAGRLDDAALAACWGAASVWATASEHEGLCAPVLEAMAWDVPVVARACAAIPETAGPAALLVPPSAPPAAMAEALAAAIIDTDLRAALVGAGRRRLAGRSPDAARAVARRALEALVSA